MEAREQCHFAETEALDMAVNNDGIMGDCNGQSSDTHPKSKINVIAEI